MEERFRDFKLKWNKILWILAFIAFLWLVQLLNFISGYIFLDYGILPRHISGLMGIILSPFIHGSFIHLVSNSIPLLVFLSLMLIFYEKEFLLVSILGTLLTGLLIWLFGRLSIHVGASGMVYCLAGFLVAIGIFRKDVISLIVSISIIALYGGMVWGILPLKSWISWEGHLFGLLSGILFAYLLKGNKQSISKSESMI
ncbi:MAG: rhomboid family intramembrane serine protease [Bacteroidales bacterium]|nr:rhomboid family intramembrane serine protease [Bacteroidales bacterium]